MYPAYHPESKILRIEKIKFILSGIMKIQESSYKAKYLQ